MARKKSNELGGFLFILAIIVLFLVAWVTPVVMFLGMVVYTLLARPIMKTITSEKTFEVTDEDTLAINELKVEVERLGSAIDAEHDSAKASKVSTNKDGSYSARSKKGKEILANLAELEPAYEEVSEQLESDPRNPQVKWEKFNNLIINHNAFTLSWLAWFCTIVYFWLGRGRDSIGDVLMPYISVVYNQFSEKGEYMASHGDDLWIIGVSAVSAIVVFFSAKLLLSEPALKFVAKPI